MKKEITLMSALAGLVIYVTSLAACATTGGTGYEEQAAQGVDVFAGKNWNAPEHNNMYDRWEFNTDGTFHFWHVHHGEPLDRGVCRYELKGGTITVTKEGTGENAAYAYAFSGTTVTLTPVEHGNGEHDTTEHNAVEHSPAAAGGHAMGALPEAPVTFTEAR
jgi:predicted small secreted protein